MTKGEINNLSEQLKADWGKENFSIGFHKLEQVVSSKNKFPSLEMLAVAIYAWLPVDARQHFIEKVIQMDHIGSYPFCGKLIQLDLERDVLQAFRLAAWSIHNGNVWYACDTISERVYGVGLLEHWDKAFPLVKKLSKSKNYWDRRGVGVATHLAVKWGLDKSKAELLLDLALEHIKATNHEEKTGIGWGMKTIAKFHPNIIKERSLEKGSGLPAWMASKVRKGMALAEIHQAKLRQKKG